MKFFLTALLVLTFVGCERSPESLEEWRNAEGGFEKMAEWAASSDEPMPVRVRSLEILIESEQVNNLADIMEKTTDADRGALVDGIVPFIAKRFEKRDWPVIKEKESKTGLVKVEASESVTAKDAAFYLQPYATAASKEKLEGMLAEWVSEDQDVRTQLGNTTVGQVSARAGDQGLKHLVKWLETTNKVASVANEIRKHKPSEEILASVATVVRKRADAVHPDLKKFGIEVAVLQTQHENIVPYLQKALFDPETPPALIDSCMDVLARVKGAKATPVFSKLIAERMGLMRWVSAQRLIEIRGKAGILAALKSLPLGGESYATPDPDSFKTDADAFCNFVDTEMKKTDVKSVADVLGRGLESDRWPVQVVSLQCAGTTKESSLKSKVDALSGSKTAIPGWGGAMTIGGLAKSVSAKL